MSAFADVTGQQFGRLTALEVAHRATREKPHTTWLCQCSCGNTHVVPLSSLRSGGTRSCGCLRREWARERGRLYRQEGPTYLAVHKRIYTDRGKAHEHLCVTCGEQAQHWAYDHSDPNPLTQVVNGTLVTYSTDTSRFQPMCIVHHRAFDKVDS